jgi:hypothetical protein
MLTTFKIDIKKATSLVLNFLLQKNLQEFAINRSIGGVVAEDSLRHIGVTYYGTMSWFCWNDEPPFLAFEDGQYDPSTVSPCTPPITDTMMRSTFNLKYDRAITIQDVEEFIKEPITAITADQKIPTTRVLELLGGIPLDGGQGIFGRPFNKYPFGFFENNKIQDMDDFLDQSGLTHVKYLYGFDDSDNDHMRTNRIRIVMVGIKNDGTTIAVSTPDMGTKENPILVQKSWPPPPNT